MVMMFALPVGGGACSPSSLLESVLAALRLPLPLPLPVPLPLGAGELETRLRFGAILWTAQERRGNTAV